MNPKKTIGAIVYKLEEKGIIDKLIEDGFEIIKLNNNDSYVYKDANRLSAAKLIVDLREYGVYVIRSSVVRTLVYSGENILKQNSEYLM